MASPWPSALLTGNKKGASNERNSLIVIALNLFKPESTKPKEPIRGKRIYAALDPAYMESIIGLAHM